MSLTPVEIKNRLALYQALMAAKADLPVVEKEATAVVPTRAGGTYTYSYADLADMEEAITPVLTTHGLIVDFEKHTDTDGKDWLYGILVHVKSGEYKTSEWEITGRTNQDRGADITYGRRYLLGILTGVVTDKDTDGKRPTGVPKTRTQPTPRKNTEDLADADQKAWLFSKARAGVPVDDIMSNTIGPDATADNLTREQAAKLITTITATPA